MQPAIFFIAFIAALQIQYGARSDAAISGYLDFDNLPETNFSCEGKVIGGYYADVETGCQMFHVCTIGQKGEVTDIKFLCLNGTVFDQETRVCERIDEVDCSQAEEFYGLNLELYGANAYIAGVSGSIIQEDLDDAANSEEVETSTVPSTTPSSTTITTTVVATTPSIITTTTTGTTPSTPVPRPPTPSPSAPPKFVPPSPKPSSFPHHQYDPTSPETLSLLAFAQNQNHEGLPDVVPHQHQQIFHNSQRPHLQTTRPPLVSTTRRPVLNLNLKHQLTSNRPPLPQSMHPSHFPVTLRPTQLGQNQPHRLQQQSQPTLQSFKQYQLEQKEQQELQRQKEDQQRQDQFSTQHHYFGNGYHKHNFQHHTQIPHSSPSSILSPSPSPSPLHLLSPPPAPSPSPSQAPYHQTQPFHPLILNGLSLEQGQHASPTPSPTPSGPHQSFYTGHHFSSSVPSIREGKSLEQDGDPEATHEAHTQHQQQLQQQHQQQIQQQHQQQIHQQQQQQIHQQQQQQIQQQKIEERQQQQIKQQQQQQKQQQHFPPPPTVAIVSSSSSTSTSHSSVAIVTGGFNNGATSSTTTPNPPPVTSTSISISGPSGGGHTIIDHGLPIESSGPSAEASTEIYDEEYSDSDYSLDSFFDDVPKIHSDGRVGNRRRRNVKDERGFTSSQDVRDEVRRSRGRSRYVQTSVAPEKEELSNANREALYSHTAPSARVKNAIQQTKPQEQVRISLVRASSRAQTNAEEHKRDRSHSTNKKTQSRRRLPLLEVPAVNEKDNISVSEELAAVSPTTSMLPETSFTCDDKIPGGLYADPETDCQLFHICSLGRHGKLVDNKFLCGPETLFNQQSRTCQVKEMVDCASSPSYYFLNKHSQHQLFTDEAVYPELQFEPFKVREKRNLLFNDAGKINSKQQQMFNGILSTDKAEHNSFDLKHCFYEKKCDNKWQNIINLRNFGGSRQKRNAPNLNGRLSRFKLSARRTTTEKPKQSTPIVIRFPNRDFLKPIVSPSRQLISTTTATPQKTSPAPHSLIPSHTKFKRPQIEEINTTEAPTRRPLFNRPVSKHIFNRRVSTSVKSEEGNNSMESNKERGNKLPITFRKHQILAPSKVPKLIDELKVDVMDVSTKPTVEIVAFEAGISPVSEEKYETDVQYDDEEYKDEEGKVRDKITIEGNHNPDIRTSKNKSILKISTNEKDIKTENNASIKTQMIEVQLDENKSENQNKAVFNEDEEAYSDEYYDEDTEAENDNRENLQKKFLLNGQNKVKIESANQPETLKISHGRIYVNQNEDTLEDMGEDSYEEDSYEDDWESEEFDDTNSEKQDDAEGIHLSVKYKMDNGNDFGYYDDRDVTDISSHRITLSSKHDSELGLSEGEEDDFEETNRAVRKTSIGRRNQAFDNEKKKIKVVHTKSSYDKDVEDDAVDIISEEHDVIDQDEKLKDNEEVEGDEKYISQIPRKFSKFMNDQGTLQIPRQRISLPVNNENKPKTIVTTKNIVVPLHVDDNGPLIEEDDDYVEYDDSTTSRKSIDSENKKISNKKTVNDQGSLLHLPIPLLRNGKDRINYEAIGTGAAWEDGEESLSFEQDDDEYINEENDGFQDDDEEYDDQEDGHIHDEKKTFNPEDEESYPDEEEEPKITRGKIIFHDNRAGGLQVNNDQEDYYDEEEESTDQDNPKDINLKDVEYELTIEDDKKIQNDKQYAAAPVLRKKGGDMKAPLPYLRLVSPEEEQSTGTSSTPNLFRTTKSRQRSWKQASAPEPPPVVISQRTTLSPELEKTFHGNYRRTQGTRVTTLAEIVDNNDKEVPRRWQPKQERKKESIEYETTPTTKIFNSYREKFNENNDMEDSHRRRDRHNLRASKYRSSTVLSTTPTYPIQTSQSITSSTKNIRNNRPRLRSILLKKISDKVQFSESQVSKNTHNLPVTFQDDDKDLEQYWLDDSGHKRTFRKEYIDFKDRSDSDIIESNTQESLSTIINSTSSIPESAALSSVTYFPLPPTTFSPPTLGTFSCIGLEMYIYHADPSNPQLFHYCSPGFSRGQILDFRFSCVKEMNFNEEKQRCVSK